MMLCIIPTLSGQVKAEPRISGEYEQELLEHIFEEWQNRYGIYVSYRQKLLKGVRVSAKLKEETLSEACRILLRETPLEASLSGEVFVLLTEKKSHLDQRICGRLLNEHGEPIAFASIRIGSGRRGTISRQDGSFDYILPEAYPDSLTITHLGYAERSLAIASLLETPCPTIQLDSKENAIEGVLISEYLTDGISQDELSIRLTPNAVSALPGLTEPDMFAMAQVVPGISSPDETISGIYVRGGTPDQTLVQHNGIPLYQTGHFFDMISSINPFAVELAQVYRSGYGVDKNGGISGLIDISQGEKVPAKAALGGILNLTHAGLDASVPLVDQKAALFLSVRRSVTDLISSVTFQRLEDRVFQSTRIGFSREDEDLELTRDQYFFQDGSIKLILQPDASNTISLSGYGMGNLLDIDVVSQEGTDFFHDEYRVQNLGSSFSWAAQVDSGYHIQHSLSYSGMTTEYINFETFIPDNIDIAGLNRTNTLTDLRFLSEHHLSLGKGNDLHAGYQLNYQDAAAEISFRELGESGEDNLDASGWTHAWFLAYQLNRSRKWHLTTGLRLTYFQPNDEWYLDPRFRLQFDPSDKLKLKLFGGQYHQFISQVTEFDVSFLGIPDGVWTMTEGEEIPDIRGIQFGGGLLWEEKGWLLDVEAYVKRQDNLSTYSSSLQPLLYRDPDFFTGNGDMMGLDVLIKKRWLHHRSWLSYSLSRVQYTFPEFSTEAFAAPQDQRHQLQLVHVYSQGNLELSAGWTLRSGKPFTPEEAQIRESETDDQGNTFIIVRPEFGELNSARLPAFHRLDLSVMYHFQGKKARPIRGTVGLSLLNVYNRTNLLSTQFFTDYFEVDTPAEELTTDRIDKELLRFTPNIMLRLRW
ncbi:MAG: TonB-dependent receptor [Bacteroidota bacterium]